MFQDFALNGYFCKNYKIQYAISFKSISTIW